MPVAILGAGNIGVKKAMSLSEAFSLVGKKTSSKQRKKIIDKCCKLKGHVIRSELS